MQFAALYLALYYENGKSTLDKRQTQTKIFGKVIGD